MEVTLLHNTPLKMADAAIGKCWDKTAKDWKGRIYKVANKKKHASTIEHINYSFNITGISRACLQELARHRHQSLSVKSSRYTLKELKKESSLYPDMVESRIRANNYLVFTGDELVDVASINALETLRLIINTNKSNDIAKYCMPEAYKTSLVSTMNMRALQNFLYLRTDKAALWEIRDLANEMFKALPEEHKFMLNEFVKDYDEESI